MTTSLGRHGDFFGLLDNYLGTSWDYLRTNFKYLGIYRGLLWHRQIPQPYSLGTCGSHCTSILRWSGVRWTEEQRTPCLNQQRPSQQCLEYRRLEGRRPRKERNILSLQLQPRDHLMWDLIQQAQLNTHDCSTILKRILFYPLYYDTILIFEDNRFHLHFCFFSFFFCCQRPWTKASGGPFSFLNFFSELLTLEEGDRRKNLWKTLCRWFNQPERLAWAAEAFWEEAGWGWDRVSEEGDVPALELGDVAFEGSKSWSQICPPHGSHRRTSRTSLQKFHQDKLKDELNRPGSLNHLIPV